MLSEFKVNHGVFLQLSLALLPRREFLCTMQPRMCPGSLHPHLLPRGCPWWLLTSVPGPWLFSSRPFTTLADHGSFLPQNLDITKKKLVHEGPLTWRVTKDKAVGECTHTCRGQG